MALNKLTNLFFSSKSSSPWSAITLSYLTNPAFDFWSDKLGLFPPGDKGFNPNKFPWAPKNPTPACAIVEVGKYTPWLTVPPAVPAPTEASVLTDVLDNTFCFAINNKPFGDFKSKNICVNRLTSFTALIGAIKPPRNSESVPPVLNTLEGSELSDGMSFRM